MGLLLLRRACLVWHGGVCSLQSTGEIESKALRCQAEAQDITAGSGCSRGRKGARIYVSENVQSHAERVE